MRNLFAGGAVPLWANLGPPTGYKVTAPAEAAHYYAVTAGVFMAFAALLAGYGLLRRRTLAGKYRRVLFLAVAGCVSVGWAAAWVWQNAGRAALVPTGGVWNLAVDLPVIWQVVLIALLAVAAARVVRGCAGVVSGGPTSTPSSDREGVTARDAPGRD
jgi:hypothetical protein